MAELRLLGDVLGLTPEQIADIAEHCDRNEQDPRFLSRERAAAAEVVAQDLEDLQSMTNKALSGAYGQTSKKAAEAWQQKLYGEPNRDDMQRLRLVLQRIPGRQSA